MLRTILTILQVLSAFAIVGLVLLQRGKGADAGAGFGAGASGTVFGARGATTGLSRMTAIFAAIFMLNSLCLTYLFQRDARAQPASLLDKVAESATAPAPVPAAPAPAPDANAVPMPAAPAEQAPPEAVKKP
ncbi:MAG TPA: preprotein translocase subunit SecG [Steroidobacteraceae bacterium]|jgi:preprotein translocase subunit SecG|nr:preprotein translocase subunit SecG [Steroidobacteraceae bacterium]